MIESHLLNGYLAAIGKGRDGDRSDKARLVRGQFHDVVLLGSVAYRFPRDEESRRLLPARAALLSALGNCQLPVAIPGLLSKAALRQPLGRCHVALHRVPGQPIERGLIVGPVAESTVVSDLAELLDRLRELGADPAIRKVVPGADLGRWEQFANKASTVLFPLMSDNGQERARAELDRVLTIDPTGEALVHGDLGGTNLLWTPAEREPRLTGVLDWDEAHIGSQADDLASIAATFGWRLAIRLDAHRHAGDLPTIPDAKAIAATFALQQALPAALSGDVRNLANGLITYSDSTGGSHEEDGGAQEAADQQPDL